MATFFQPEWLKRALGERRPTLILDIGSYNGDEIVLFRQNFPSASVWGFEASPRNYARTAERNLIADPQVRLWHAAVSDVDGKITFYDTCGQADGSGSILTPTPKRLEHETIKFAEGTEVQTFRIDTLCKENNISHIDMIHMDAQGAEYKILLGMGDMRPTAIFLEINEEDMYEGAKSGEFLNEYLGSLGYQLKEQCPFDNFYVLQT